MSRLTCRKPQSMAFSFYHDEKYSTCANNVISIRTQKTSVSKLKINEFYFCFVLFLFFFFLFSFVGGALYLEYFSIDFACFIFQAKSILISSHFKNFRIDFPIPFRYWEKTFFSIFTTFTFNKHFTFGHRLPSLINRTKFSGFFIFSNQIREFYSTNYYASRLVYPLVRLHALLFQFSFWQ